MLVLSCLLPSGKIPIIFRHGTSPPDLNHLIDILSIGTFGSNVEIMPDARRGSPSALENLNVFKSLNGVTAVGTGSGHAKDRGSPHVAAQAFSGIIRFKRRISAAGTILHVLRPLYRTAGAFKAPSCNGSAARRQFLMLSALRRAPPLPPAGPASTACRRWFAAGFRVSPGPGGVRGGQAGWRGKHAIPPA